MLRVSVRVMGGKEQSEEFTNREQTAIQAFVEFLYRWKYT